MNEEVWKPTQYTGYSVSNLGRVSGPHGILATNDNGRGYLSVMMSLNNRPFRRYVHRLVAMAFLPNINKYPQVNHKDGNKQNNNVNNLEWCTQKQNNQHAWATGLQKSYERTAQQRERVSKTVKKLWQAGVYKPYLRTDEMKERMRLAQLQSVKKKRGKQHPCAKPVVCVETGEMFECIRYADRKYGGSGVKGIAAGKQQTAYGLHWKIL